MSAQNFRLTVLATLLTLITAGSLCAATADDVRAALGVLNRVVAHTQRLITAKNTGRLPHEDGEFKEGIEALKHALAHEPTDLKTRVEPLIQKAVANSQALASAAGGGDPATLGTAHAALADSVRELVEAFPADERPASPPTETR